MNEILEQKYDPKSLNKQAQGNLYRVKTRGRKDLRLLGFIGKDHSKNESMFERYNK
ncbi:hypothetical protein J2Z82_000047 [Virgibacillus litoralis]|uniref:Uncharacterized protein n=1 Tax=Virgibacillus litoralis TaxID=578221 RepID=A0ABS4H891_9BACI|nr:hypothetical protein [Virgibacillus litoralis]